MKEQNQKLSSKKRPGHFYFQKKSLFFEGFSKLIPFSFVHREFLSFESVLLLYSKVIFQHVGEQSLAYVHLMANQHSFHNKLNEAQELFLDLAVIASIVLSPLIHNLSIYSKKIQFLNNLLPSLLNLLKHTNSVCSSLERESQETDLSEEIDAFTFSWTPRSPLPFVTEGNGGISYSLPKTFNFGTSSCR